jgi:hypothetical protein
MGHIHSNFAGFRAFDKISAVSAPSQSEATRQVGPRLTDSLEGLCFSSSGRTPQMVCGGRINFKLQWPHRHGKELRVSFSRLVALKFTGVQPRSEMHSICLSGILLGRAPDLGQHLIQISSDGLFFDAIFNHFPLAPWTLGRRAERHRAILARLCAGCAMIGDSSGLKNGAAGANLGLTEPPSGESRLNALGIY